MSFYRYSVSRVCPGSPRCLFTGTEGVDSGLAAVLAAVESVAVFVRVCVLWVWVDGCEVHPCDPFARVRLCVPCVPCVSRLPPVSFYRYRVLILPNKLV